MNNSIVRIALMICGLALAAESVGRTSAGTGIVYGEDFAYAIQAPPGWILDNAAANAQGMYAAFYEEGRTWRTADTIMYANAACKQPGQQTVDELIAYDVSQFQARAPGLKVTRARDLPTSERTASVRHFEGDEHGNFEAVAYIDEPKAMIMLVLSSRSKSGFEKAYPSFEKLVRSYRFLTTDVRIEE